MEPLGNLCTRRVIYVTVRRCMLPLGKGMGSSAVGSVDTIRYIRFYVETKDPP